MTGIDETDEKNTEKMAEQNSGNAGKMAGETAEKMMKDNEKMVSVHTDSRPQHGRITHQPNGKFAPGNGLGGRKKRAEEDALLAVLEKALPAEDIPGHIEQCIRWAVASRPYRQPNTRGSTGKERIEQKSANR